MIIAARRIHPAALITAALTAACGGNVVVDPAGSGGAGGAPTTSSSLTTTGPMTTGPMTTGPTTSSGTSGCDNQGFCGDVESGCIGCSLSGNCADEIGLCQSDPDCNDYVECFSSCSDPVCEDQCTMEHPNGAAIYNELVFCVLCQDCYNDCDGPSFGCP